MARTKLRNGGRRKAIFGALASAGATIAAAAMQVTATNNAAKEQAKAIEANAQSTSNALAQQNNNANQLQEQLIASNSQINKENQDVMKDLILSGQLQAGNENMNYRTQANRMQVKCGGRRKLSYGGARPFKVTDGGGAIPLQTDGNGYGLYELYGNDHDHYHKTRGKAKTGVGIQFANGEVVEGEGNQSSNQGELMYVTPEDAMFISKHSLKGFNPARAVDNGMHPIKAFAYQEAIKDRFGIKDSGDKARNGKRVKAAGGLRQHWNNYGGSYISGAGNLLGAGLSTWGNSLASKTLANAYDKAGETLANAYSNMKGIDLSLINRNDYAAPQTLAAVRSANTNINPQLNKIDRTASAQIRDVDRSTNSSAARLNRRAAINDRTYQMRGEQYAYKDNIDEQIRQQNITSINQVAAANADRAAQANTAFNTARMQGLMYNNDVDNTSLMGAAQARADALTQGATIKANSLQSSIQGFANALSASGQSFGTRFDYLDKDNTDFRNRWWGLGDQQQLDAALARGDKKLLDILFNRYNEEDSESNRIKLSRINKFYNRG